MHVRDSWGNEDNLTIVSKGADHADYETSTPYGVRTAARAVITVLPEDASILFVDADRVLYDRCCSSMGNVCTGLGCESASVGIEHKLTYQIVDLS